MVEGLLSLLWENDSFCPTRFAIAKPIPRVLAKLELPILENSIGSRQGRTVITPNNEVVATPLGRTHPTYPSTKPQVAICATPAPTD